MVEKTFSVTSAFGRGKWKDLKKINEMVLAALMNGEPIYATLVEGVYAGSIARLKVGNTPKSLLSKVFRDGKNHKYSFGDPDAGEINKDLVWEMELDGTNRQFNLRWKALTEYPGCRCPIVFHLGRTGPTVMVKKEKKEFSPILSDYMGREIKDGDYVLMYSTPREVQDTGTPFRMVRYTGTRSEKQAVFTYIRLADGKHNKDGGAKVRIGLNHTAGGDQVFGVKVDVDGSLATALQMTDNDMGIYPVKFSISLED